MKKIIIPDKLYNWLKWISIAVLPALSAFYIGIAKTWGLPYASEISETLTYLEAFIAAILVPTSIAYNKNKQDESSCGDSLYNEDNNNDGGNQS